MPSTSVGSNVVGAGVIAQLEHLAWRVLFDQLARRTDRHDLAPVHHDQPVAQLLGFVHVVRGQHERDPALLEPVQPVPQHVASLRIEPGRRLVEQQQFGLVDQCAGDRDPSLHAPRQRFDLALCAVAELHELEQLLGPPLALGARDVEVAAVQDHVVLDGQLLVELIHLRHDTHPGPNPLALGCRVEPEDPQRALRDRRDATDHPHRR